MAKNDKPAAKKPMTKSELLNGISNATNLSRRDVSAVLDALSAQISTSLGRRGAGAFTLPGLVKIEKKKVPARKASKGAVKLMRGGRDDPSMARYPSSFSRHT